MKWDLTLFRKDVVPVYITDEHNKVVNARELHAFLEIPEKFTDWALRKVNKRKLVVGKDYITFSEKSEKGRPTIVYILLLDAAKKIAMGTNNAQGDRVKDYFLECERIAHTPLVPHAVTTPLLEHTKREVQINNVKAHAKAAYEIGGKEEIIRRHTDVTLALTNKTPRQLKEDAKAQGIPSKLRKSGRECMRYQYPSAACTASLIDELGSNGVPIESILPGIPKLNDAFAFILDMGLIPRELNT